MNPEPCDRPFREPSTPAPAAGPIDTNPVDVTVPSSPRIWNYWLGGKDNYEVDRQVGDQIVRGYPRIVNLARYSRAFLGRAVTTLAGEAGLRQFLDIGSGLPAADNVHEMARRIAPDARVLYVDRDPLVLSHIRARLLDPADELVNVIEADLVRPERILAAAAEHLDLSRPVAVVLANVLGHLPSHDTACSVVRRLLRPLPPGSHLVVADGTNVLEPAFEDAIRLWNEVGSTPYHLRGPAELERFFDGLELLEPGVVPCPLWRPRIVTPDPVDEYCGVGRKP